MIISLPPLPDGWVRCSERMPEPGQWVQFFVRALGGVIKVGYRSSQGYWNDYLPARTYVVAETAVVAWRPLTVPAEVRELP